jgi:two-component system sensor histidine kinase HydH
MTESSQPPARPFWKRERWLYAGIAFLIGVFDTLVASLLGVEFTLGGRDVAMLVGIYIELSFAAFGFLIGLLVEIRRTEKLSTQVASETAAELETIRSRLAQTEKLASLGQLAGTLAHEVRNPLAIIRSSVQNLAEALDPDDAQNHETCGFILEEIDRLSHVVSSLVGFARPLRLDRSAIRTADLVEHTGLLAAPLLRDHQVRLKVLATQDGSEIEVDPDLLCQVLLGLLTNAAQASPRNGVVNLESSQNSEAIELTVTDQGPGIPAELRDKIFDPFFTTRKDGSGLGLAVAKQIVEAHGGTLTVSGLDPRGSRFAIRLQPKRLAA